MPAEPRVTVRLSLTEDDKRALSASALVHEWIERERDARKEGEL